MMMPMVMMVMMMMPMMMPMMMMIVMVTFRCITSHLAQKPDYVTWHFEERVILLPIVTIILWWS